MSQSRLFILATGVCLVVANAASAADPALGSEDLSALDYFKYWNVPMQLNPGEAITAGYLVDDSIYLVSSHGDVFAVHTGAGLLRWSQNVAESVYQVYPPSHFVGDQGVALAVISASPRTVIVDRLRGEIVADMPLDRATASGTVADARQIYFGSFDGHIYAMSWNDPRSRSAVFRWRAIAGGPVTSMPWLVNNGDDLVFASQGGAVFSCTAAVKLLNWRYETEGPITGDLAVDGNGTFVASTDRSLYRLDTISGVRRWRVRFPSSLNEGPTVAGAVVYQYCDNEGITALNAETGEKMWNNVEAHRFVSRNLQRVHFITNDGRLIAVDAADGKTVASATLRAEVVPIRNAHDDTIYLATTLGELLCAKPNSTPYLTAAQIERAQRELYKSPEKAGDGNEDDTVKPPAEDDRINKDDPLRSTRKVPPVGGGR